MLKFDISRHCRNITFVNQTLPKRTKTILIISYKNTAIRTRRERRYVMSAFVFEVYFYARLQNASRVLAMAWARPKSVRLSVTLGHCIKMVQAKITKSSLWAAPRTIAFGDEIWCR